MHTIHIFKFMYKLSYVPLLLRPRQQQHSRSKITMTATITIDILIPPAAVTITLLVLLPASSSDSPSSLLCTIVQIKHTYIYHVCYHVVAEFLEYMTDFIIGNSHKHY